MSPSSASPRSRYYLNALAGLVSVAIPAGAQSVQATRTNTATADLPTTSAAPASEHLIPDWRGYRARWSDHGFDYSVTYIGEVLGNVSGGLKPGVIYEGLLKVQLDFDTEKLGGWKSGAFHVSALYPHGEGLSQHYLGDLFTLSNIDADDSLRLFEFWYEQQIVPGRLSLRLGQLGADEEFASTESGAAFINGTVGWPAVIAANAHTPAYPVGTPGARLAINLGQGWALQTAVYNGDPCAEDSASKALNAHGVSWSFRDAFFIAELKRAWNHQETETGLPGQAKFGGWYHTGEFDHQRLDDTARSLGDPASTGHPLQIQGDWGLYLTAEQQLWRKSAAGSKSKQGLGLFTRLGASPGDRNPLAYYAEGGVTYTGLVPGREEDVCGVAVVHGHMSQDARRLAEECNRRSATADPLPDYEMVVEATYRVAVRPGLKIQPVAACVIHPGGAPGHNALVIGLRTSLDL